MASSMGEKGEIMTKCKNFVDLDYPNLVPRVEKGNYVSNSTLWVYLINRDGRASWIRI